MELEWYHYGIAIFGGFAAGVINTLAGSGSAITLTILTELLGCLLYTSPSPRDATLSRMPSSA